MKIVILAFESDAHTAALRWALEQRGYSVASWAGLSWMDDRQATLWFDQETRIRLGDHEIETGDVVWIRRPNPPLPDPAVTDADRLFAESKYKGHSRTDLRRASSGHDCHHRPHSHAGTSGGRGCGRNPSVLCRGRRRGASRLLAQML